MSDDMWDWGSGRKPNPVIAPEYQTSGLALKSKKDFDAEKAKRDADEQRRIEALKAIDEQARIRLEQRAKIAEQVEERQKAIAEAVDQDKTSTHIWIGQVEGNIRNETKAITGKTLDAASYVRLDDVIKYGLRIVGNHPSIGVKLDIQSAMKVAAIRLTKSQAAKAKLSSLNKQVVIEDEDGTKWKSINSLVGVIKKQGDMSFHNDILIEMVRHISTAAPAV